MNVFAGNIVVSGDTHINLEQFDYIESLSKDGNKTLYIFGETEIKKPDELEQLLKEKLGDILHYDISLSSGQAVGVTPYDYEAGVYECASFEGENISFDEIAGRFEEAEGVFSIREAEVSKLFGNKIIRVDFIY